MMKQLLHQDLIGIMNVNGECGIFVVFLKGLLQLVLLVTAQE